MKWRILGDEGSSRTTRLNERLWEWYAQHALSVFMVGSALWILFLYWPALTSPFVYDDVVQIQHNQSLATWHDMMRLICMRTPHTNDLLVTGQSFYRPIFWLSLALDRSIWGLQNVEGFHLTNLLLHWGNGVLGFCLLRRLRVSLRVASCSVLLWLGAPINSEVVAWASGRPFSLMMVFTFAALLAEIRYLTCGGRWILLSFMLFTLLAALSHESGILVVPLSILTAYNSGLPHPRGVLRTLGVSMVGVLGLYFVFRRAAGADGAVLQFAPWQFGSMLVKYLGWMVLPLHMSIERSTDLPPNHYSFWAFGTLFAIACLLGTAIVARRSVARLSFPLGWLVISLVPFCGLVAIYQGMAERYLYLAEFGLCSVLVLVVSSATRREVRHFAVIATAVWMLWGADRLHRRASAYSDPERLYRDSLTATPSSSKLRYNLAAIREQRGDLLTAGLLYQEVLQQLPSYEPAMAGLGNVFLRTGNVSHALAAYRQALGRNPGDAKTMVNFALALAKANDLQAAEGTLKRVIVLDPKSGDAYCDLAVVLVEEKRVQEAIDDLERAVDLNPGDTTAYDDLGALYESTGRTDFAVDVSRKALSVDPNDADAADRLRQLRGTQ